ncbi:MAG: FAD binding domain-containing protein [Acidimicrobiales bacterium]|jgi:carbon-monoxide dehydrogenase medium subunit|nr:FAD binding domain-containing protein [Acidimicrobiales bacterium]
MNLEAGLLHESQRPGTQIEKVLRPASWTEALKIYESFPTALPIAGATDLMLEIQREEASGSDVVLIDIWGLPECTQISVNDRDIEIGCAVTHNQVIDSDGLDPALDLLRMACLEVGSPQLRNRATVVGNIVTASPANDTISALVALDSSVVIDSSTGSRELPMREFFTGFRATALNDCELVRSIKVPLWNNNTIGTWLKVGNRSAQAISVVHAGIVLELDETTSAINRADIAIGSVSEIVSISTSLKEYLIGKELNEETIDGAAEIAGEHISPIDDIRGTAVYRQTVTKTAIHRALSGLSDGFLQDAAIAPLLGWSVGRREPSQSDISATTEISCEVNGSIITAPLGNNSTLLEWLRETVSRGTKEGCSEGECGACTVQLNGSAVTSCLVPTAQADGACIVTVEGLAQDQELHPVQQSFLNKFAVQCGFCTPGFLVAAASLLNENKNPSADEIRSGLAGNLCRCTGYYSILEALQAAGEMDNVS